MLQKNEILHSDYLLPDHTHKLDKDRIEVWIYPGCDSLRIFKRPRRLNEDLLDLTMNSVLRPYDLMLNTMYGYGYRSPGLISTLHARHKNINHQRLVSFAAKWDTHVYYLTTTEFLQEYQNVYDAQYPDGVLQVLSEHDDYTADRLRHLWYFHGDEMIWSVKSFVEGIGKKLQARHTITDKQREFIKSLFKQYNNQEHNALPGAYATYDKKTPF